MLKSNVLKTPTNSIIQNIWEILDCFKHQSKLQDWEISEHEDWIKTSDGKYHNFVWIRSVHPSTFDRVCGDYKIGIREEHSYSIITVSYIAWLFLESPPENIIRKVEKNSRYSKRIAIYDLSQALTDKFPCLKLNKTDSRVFREFEKFVKRKLQIEIEPIFQNQF